MHHVCCVYFPKEAVLFEMIAVPLTESAYDVVKWDFPVL